MHNFGKYRGFIFIAIGLSIFLIIYFSYMNRNDLGLRFLSLAKKILANAVDVGKLSENESRPISHAAWDSLLQKYVSNDGAVNYRGFLQEKARFYAYLDSLSNHPPNDTHWTKDEKLAYWINAYNAFTVELILEHYPVKSIKDIAGNIPMINSPWDLKFFNIGGVDFDLNTIEHDILRKKFREPRIHFAINCASKSCPKLLNEAFSVEKIDQQLQAQAVYFVNNAEKNRIQPNKIAVSQIFDWFQTDFTKNDNLIGFLNQFSRTKIAENAAIRYLEYNWRLNEKARKEKRKT